MNRNAKIVMATLPLPACVLAAVKYTGLVLSGLGFAVAYVLLNLSIIALSVSCPRFRTKPFVAMAACCWLFVLIMLLRFVCKIYG